MFIEKLKEEGVRNFFKTHVNMDVDKVIVEGNKATVSLSYSVAGFSKSYHLKFILTDFSVKAGNEFSKIVEHSIENKWVNHLTEMFRSEYTAAFFKHMDEKNK